MNDRREFSFIESVNREFGNANVGGGIYQGSLGQSRQANQFESINIGQINDTVSRLHGLNTSEMKKNAGFMYGPDGAACNPFIGDSYLFMNNSVSDTNNFGQGQQHSSHETSAMNGPATSYSNYMSQPQTGARRSLSGNSGNAVVAPQIINQMKEADEGIT